MREMLAELKLRTTSKGRLAEAVRRVDELLRDPRLPPKEELDDRFWDVMCGRVVGWRTQGEREEAARALAAVLERYPGVKVEGANEIRALARATDPVASQLGGGDGGETASSALHRPPVG
eukprot:tig00000215_g18667.t1